MEPHTLVLTAFTATSIIAAAPQHFPSEDACLTARASSAIEHIQKHKLSAKYRIRADCKPTNRVAILAEVARQHGSFTRECFLTGYCNGQQLWISTWREE